MNQASNLGSLPLGRPDGRTTTRHAKLAGPRFGWPKKSLADPGHQLESSHPQAKALVEFAEAFLELLRANPLLGEGVAERGDTDVLETHGKRAKQPSGARCPTKRVHQKTVPIWGLSGPSG